MLLIAFLYIFATIFVISGIIILLCKNSIKISDRLISFISLGSIPAAVKAKATRCVVYHIAGKYKYILGAIFITLGMVLIAVAIRNYSVFREYI